MKVFTFSLVPSDHTRLSSEHSYWVHHGMCEIFFDLAFYPCKLEWFANAPAFYLARQATLANGPDDALDQWEAVQDDIEHKRRLVCHVVLIVSRTNPRRTIEDAGEKSLWCHEEMTRLYHQSRYSPSEPSDDKSESG